MKFTLEDLRSAPAAGRIYSVWDSKLAGFGCRIYPGGKKAFVLRLRFVDESGVKKERLHTVGALDDFAKIEDARGAATKVRQQYKAGVDPKLELKRQQLAGRTVADLMEEWLADRLATGKHKQSTTKDVRRAAREGWQDWVKRPLNSISPEDVLLRHGERSKVAKARSNLEVRYFRALWRWAQARYGKELRLDPSKSPSSKLNAHREWNPSRRKSRRLESRDFGPWLEAVEGLENIRARHLFKLLLLTGLRLSEATALDWSDVNISAGTVFISDPKNRNPLTLPLNSHAIDVLRKRLATAEDPVIVFPAVSSKTGEIVRIENPSKAIAWIKRESGIEWSPHDLRRSFISVGGTLGVNPIALRILTNHALPSGDAHAGYHIPEMDELRRVTQAIGDRIIGSVRVAPVVPFPSYGIVA